MSTTLPTRAPLSCATTPAEVAGAPCSGSRCQAAGARAAASLQSWRGPAAASGCLCGAGRRSSWRWCWWCWAGSIGSVTRCAMCVCVRARAHARVHACVHIRMCACVYALVCNSTR